MIKRRAFASQAINLIKNGKQRKKKDKFVKDIRLANTAEVKWHSNKNKSTENLIETKLSSLGTHLLLFIIWLISKYSYKLHSHISIIYNFHFPFLFSSIKDILCPNILVVCLSNIFYLICV